MTVQTFAQPDYAGGTQSGSVYPTNIDKAIAVMAQIAAAFAPHATATPGMTLQVDAGALFVANAMVIQAQQTTASIAAAASGKVRIDRVVIDASTGGVSVITGAEVVSSPVAPAIPVGKLPVCQVGQIGSATTALTNSMITDERVGAGAGGSTLPAGAVVHVAQNTAPSGFVKANGAAISRTTYATLFAAIGTTFGVGDGSTTFNVPDLRAEFIRGWDDSRGVDSGRGFGTAQTDAFQGHYHSGVQVFVNTGLGGGTGGVQTTTSNTGAPVTDGTNGTPRTAAETRPRNVALLACIKY